MKRIIFLATIILFLLGAKVNSQQSFELTIGVEGTEGLFYTFENGNSYISLGGRKTEIGYEVSIPIIYVINQEGLVVDERIFTKQDTSFGFSFGFVKPNGNFFIAGLLSDSVTPFDYNITYICEMTPDLDIINEKMDTLPFPQDHCTHSIQNFLITPDDKIIIEGRIDTSYYSYDDILYLAKYDMDGNLINFIPYLNWKDGFGSELIFNPDSTGFYLIGDLSYGDLGIVKDWIEFDLDLNILDNGLIENELSYFNSPMAVCRLSNGNIIIANRSYEINGTSTQDLEMRIVDPEFNLLRDTILYHDEYVNVPDHRGMGFIDENNIWVATYENSPPFFTGTEVFKFFIFDSNLSLKGVKVYGGNTRYWFFDLLATSDGGCLLTGVVPEYEGSPSEDCYLIKVMTSDILTLAEETPFENDMDVFVYPNPFSDKLKTETMRLGLTLNLFDSHGNLVLDELISDLPNETFKTDRLSPGFYYYQITDNFRIIQNGKLVKN